MDAKRRISVVFALALLITLSVELYWSTPVSAMTPTIGWESARLQPPPEAPSAPPPGSGAAPGDDEPTGPSDEPSYPDNPPADEESYEPEEPYAPEEPYVPEEPYEPEEPEEQDAPDAPPAEPSFAPLQLEPLPDPSGGFGVQNYALPQAVGVAGGLNVSIDQGCGSTYEEGDSIQFSVSADWEVFNPDTDWWRYLEIWGSTNGEWWHQIARGRWIEPRESVYVRAWIAAPTGDERIYARLLDRNGGLLEEANCYYTSQEEASTPPPATGDLAIACDETVSGSVSRDGEEIWYFEGWSGQRVTITMYGHAGFDTFLELFDPNGNFVASHDDISRQNKNARIRLTLQRSGEFTIIARGYDYRAGSYTLYVDC